MDGSEGYELVTLANGVCSVHARAYGETFHPVIGPVAEAEALYVRQVRLRDRVRSNPGGFVVWDVGLGAAANALTVLRATRDLAVPIHLVSFDRTLEPLRFALEHAEALGYLGGYEQTIQQLAGGTETRLRVPDGARTVEWEVWVVDFPTFLGQAKARGLAKPHAVLFDAFSPATNPEMWTLPLFSALHALLDPARPCSLPTYSRSTLLRVTLLLAGFWVGTGHATGEKEETTLAANTPELIDEPLDAAWLRRAQRSTSAEPLREPVYRQGRLSSQSWDLLQRHPQFR